MPKTKQKVLVAMSGGVDSSVAAYLILRKGFEAVGATMKLYNNQDIDVPKEKRAVHSMTLRMHAAFAHGSAVRIMC